MTIFFVSDTHFGHQNIIKYTNRPYNSVEEMDEGLVSMWNSQVSNNDVVYHLGDMAFHNYQHIGRLNGKISLVPGNHDHERLKKIVPYITTLLDEVHYLKVDKEHRFVLCHYPFESWRREYKYHLHGHTHGAGKQAFNRLDVGVDANRFYAPIDLDAVMSRIERINERLMNPSEPP